MQLTVTSGTGIVFTVDVGEDMELENLLALCQIEVPDWAAVPLQQFILVHNGVTYNRDGEMLKRTIKVGREERGGGLAGVEHRRE